MLKKVSILLVLICLTTQAQNGTIIPQPQSVQMGKESFKLSSKTTIKADKKSFEANYLREIIKQQTGLELEINPKKGSNSIQLISKVASVSNAPKEAYSLNITAQNIVVTSQSSQGLFYGIQTLIQLIPFEKKNEIILASLEIVDQPKFQWRGMHLDVCRHFFPKEFIKKYIDFLAMYKMNTFHWHLTDDQGWRIEIKKYPKLTQVGAWRNGSMTGHYSDQTFDELRYGGFYTQEDIKEIVAYANQRHITIVPEIEMPGHAVAALASYPEFSCTGGPFEVAKIWGVLDDVFCPKEETFTFLENILSEVMTLFPSEYIHIGGDECPKIRWKNCAHCQKRIQDEKLKDEHELQSYFIQRIEKFVNSKGRKIIGWDEILEGGLAPNAAVMSWRGFQGGIDAAKQKHYVVMSPGSHCYFDHYQGEPKNEPISFGGYTNVEKVYSFNPIPKELTTEEAKYILGGQANLWTEYINTPQHAEYMVMPRMAALAEVLWGTSNPDQYKEFEKRLIHHFDSYKAKNINFSKAIYEVTTKAHPTENKMGLLFELKSANPSGIRYTTDGSQPNINSLPYKNPISITFNQTVKAGYFEEGILKSAITEQVFEVTKSTGRKIELQKQPHENYGIGGSFSLVDGMIGNPSKFGRDWLGFWGEDLVATIDLGKEETISKVKINTLSSEGSWIHLPKEIQIAVSNDAVNFKTVKVIAKNEIDSKKGRIEAEFSKTPAKYIKVTALNNGIIVEGKPGAGSKCWLFVDEISVE